ncbi:MAG: flagellar protein FlgN [Wigglesworthia glossinidia]|nr:flagellar protein FlgN [Wigglesworthia glossinidia]
MTKKHYFKKLNEILKYIFLNLKRFKKILLLESIMLSSTPVNYANLRSIVQKKQTIIDKLNCLDSQRVFLEKIINIKFCKTTDIKSNHLWNKIKAITFYVYKENEKNNKKINSHMQLINSLYTTFKKVIPENILYRSDGNSYKFLTKNFRRDA